MLTESYPQGVVMYRGKSLIGPQQVVVIATGLVTPSKNKKTGPMIQVYILIDELDPLEAIRQGGNQGACGKCGFQGYWDTDAQKFKDVICYVNKGQGPSRVWDADYEANYPAYDEEQHRHLFAGRRIRWGAYGDPAAMPVAVIRKFSAICDGHTGYSNQLFWIDKRRANALAQFLQCSCANRAQDAEAKRRGWRTFLVVPKGKEGPSDSIECPYYTRGINCHDCLLCSGEERNAKSIWVEAHAMTGLNHRWEDE